MVTRLMSRRRYLPGFIAAGLVGLAATIAAGQRPASPELKIPEQPPAASVPAAIQNYPAVTAARLARPADGEWLMLRRTYDGWGYSPLAQINASNVSRLKPVWVMSTGVNNAHEAPPIVNGDVMFVALAHNQVIAIDVKSGMALWRYRSEPVETRGKPVSRGVSLYGDKVYFSLTEAVLVAVDARTGKEAWRATVGDNGTGQYLTAPPLVADGKLIVGVSGGDAPNRGYVSALDPETGKQIWKTYTIPGPGEPGHETWRADDWKTGGGATWVTGNYDAETNLVYWGVGNAYPWLAVARPGDNLYTSSTIALDARSGTIKGHFQYTPNESWDFDETSPPMLVDYRRGDRTIKGLVNFARSGWLYFLERSANGGISFVDGKPYVTANTITRLDPKTGRPEFDLTRKPDIGKVAEFCPSWHGAKNWPPGAYNPKTRMVYASSQENICAVMMGRVVETPGAPTRYATSSRMFIAPGATHLSEVQGWNVDTGMKVWSHNFAKSPNWGPMMTTGGGLVFSGGTSDRLFRAHDAATGKVLWEYPTNSGVYAPATSFNVDGKQHIAVVSGWGMDPRSTLAHLNRASPGNFPEVPEGGVIWVFAVSDK
jgi:alcohol dehydrogenase (cytochrome c)